jgi:phage recombination protein Bet
MSNELATKQDNTALISVLQASVFPGAAPASIELAIGYCKAAGYDVMLKPVHIVPMWSKTGGNDGRGGMRDVIMPGIGLYRIQAARTGQFAGMSEVEFGPQSEFAGVRHPEWAKCTVKRQLSSGLIAEWTAKEFWCENYAEKGGKDKDSSPNAMWSKRAYGQLSKCVQAQALRMAFPEIGAHPTFEEMEGRTLEHDAAPPPKVTATAQAEPSLPKTHPDLDAGQFAARLPTWAKLVENGKGETPAGAQMAEKLIDSLSYTFTDEQKAQIRALAKSPVEVVEGELV